MIAANLCTDPVGHTHAQQSLDAASELIVKWHMSQEHVQQTSATLMAPAAAASRPPSQADACLTLLDSATLARPTNSRAPVIASCTYEQATW